VKSNTVKEFLTAKQQHTSITCNTPERQIYVFLLYIYIRFPEASDNVSSSKHQVKLLLTVINKGIVEEQISFLEKILINVEYT